MGRQSDPGVGHLRFMELKVTLVNVTAAVQWDRDGRVGRRCGPGIRLELDRFKEYRIQ